MAAKKRKPISYSYTKNYRFRIVVQKSAFRLTVHVGQKARAVKNLPRSFSIGIGRNPDLHSKSREGDDRTPEGVYFICQKEVLKPGSLGTRWMRLTYPNLSDIRRGRKAGIIDAETARRLRKGIGNDRFVRIESELGYGIGIHGTNRPSSIGKPCSDGCIRMRNADVEALYDLVPLGTRVEILP